ncbi:hypothetical protein CDL12_11763 [Handroanthus impetiginosus]|uniref:Uncharacterized protein n=1 Tax=Handroanthus impetiginosus TaxID=429701 RepID=A0A2G9HE79_9LAMI|nr:hypothetical protein CDL12_11763 [Handroanthus impetiginosus]
MPLIKMELINNETYDHLNILINNRISKTNNYHSNYFSNFLFVFLHYVPQIPYFSHLQSSPNAPLPRHFLSQAKSRFFHFPAFSPATRSITIFLSTKCGNSFNKFSAVKPPSPPHEGGNLMLHPSFTTA